MKADEISKERVTKFLFDQLKYYNDKLLHAQLMADDDISVDDLNEVKEDVEKLNERVNTFVTQLTNSVSASNATIDAIQDHMTSLLNTQQILQADVVT